MKLRLLCVLPALLLLSSGCIVVRDRHHHGRSDSRARYRRDCRPNQYWDGYECRHKGNGRGSRGHDR